ncbi:SCO0930 family lipoprotein [Streptomyces sp. ME02-8801-2C]|uniref:SCO0930 family lipoprotein n=1 Tax=Streptomyces sp. ME02-8801-2C TaxID=3028680 RepID=UPI0029B76116|nr:SCO0930 family lipoprotein [Streptomyces sp. ME02-8801-2C]MDX3451931.1 SCO0930 family lipoprotein [Streptomyces sp. ME02-8801-2C]
MKTSWRSASLVASAAAVLALTTACGQDKATDTSSQNVGAAAPAAGGYGSVAGTSTAGAGAGAGTGTGTGTDTGSDANGEQAAAGNSAAAGQLNVVTNAQIGKVLASSSGRTMYRFDQDTAEPPKSNCDGDCAAAWPPVPADDVSAGVGVDAGLLGEVTRADGTKQLTVGGWAAYYYAKDAAPGDIKGQGVGGKWYGLAPDGKKATLAAQPGLSTRNDPKLGTIVVDKNGMTVYRFLKDQAWPKPVSACVGACLDKWPVVSPVAFKDTKGIKEKGYMDFTRPDNGAEQQTLNCSPIYTFINDKKPGDTNGQGVGGTWYAVAPDGSLVGAPKQ